MYISYQIFLQKTEAPFYEKVDTLFGTVVVDVKKLDEEKQIDNR